jgi:plastocyanin
MTSSKAGWTVLLTLGFVAACGTDAVTVQQRTEAMAPGSTASADRAVQNDDDHGAAKIAIRDDCDPTDPAWAPTGGCLLRRGNVRFAEFSAELSSLLSPTTVVGHQAWRNDPSYLVAEVGHTVRVRNEGGRVHTYTEVAQFGGGRVPNPGLNRGLLPAPECPTSKDIAPGESVELTDLLSGNHRFQCCIHPWMRGIVKVR